MKLRFYKMKAWQEVSSYYGETCCRKVTLRFKYCALPKLFGERLLSVLFIIVGTKNMLPVVFAFRRGVGSRESVQRLF